MEHFAIAIPATWWPLGMLVLSVPIPRTDESCGFRANLALGYLRIFSWNPLKSVPLCRIDLGFGSVPLAAGQLSTSPGAHRAVAWLWSSERFFNDMFENYLAFDSCLILISYAKEDCSKACNRAYIYICMCVYVCMYVKIICMLYIYIRML